MREHCDKCKQTLKLTLEQKTLAHRRCNKDKIKPEYMKQCLVQWCRVPELMYEQKDQCFETVTRKCTPDEYYTGSTCERRPKNKPCAQGYLQTEGL